MQVRVDGQSSSDTVGKNGSHWLEVLRNKALFNNKWEHHNYLIDNDTSTRQFLALNLASKVRFSNLKMSIAPMVTPGVMAAVLDDTAC